MPILTHDQIHQLLKPVEGRPDVVEGYDPALVRTASLDVRLGDTVSIEVNCRDRSPVSLAVGQRVSWHTSKVNCFTLRPGEFVLACVQERFNIPDNVHARFTTTSSLARNGLEQMAAADMWPGFPGSLTLELKNMLRYQSLFLEAGMVIGQVTFEYVEPVTEGQSYKSIGRYAGKSGALPSIE